jgi:outer membrane protein OmpA-like peptidoglycan-associated protein
VTKNPTADNHYWLAYTLMSLDKYQEAQIHMAQFAAMKPTDSRAQLWEKQQNFLAQLQTEPAYFEWKEVSINTEHADFGVYPYPLKNSAVTISSRKKTGFGDLRWAGNNDYFLELFYVQTGEDGYLSQPIQLDRPLNSTKHEGPLCFSADGKLVYFTSNNRDEQNKQGKDGIQHLKIYIADIVRSEWLNIHEFTYNSPDYACGHPTLSPDGKTLYFTSDMPGGFGGADIYSCQINAKGEFEKPINLGANVNTSGQEIFPWIGTDELLYFSSNGRPGMGGLDLFAAPRDGKMAAKNLGLSINSVNDDFAVTFLADGKSGFIASNRKGTDDIFSIKKLLDIRFNALIKGNITDQATGQILAFATITVKDAQENVVTTTQADASGNYSFEVAPGETYTVAAKLDQYEGAIRQIQVPNANTIEQNLDLSKPVENGIRLLVTDAATKSALTGVGVVITDLQNNVVLINESTKATGDVSKQLKGYNQGNDLSLKIEISAPGYLKKTVEYKGRIDQIGIIQLHEKLNVELQPVALGGDLAKMLSIKPIYFDLGKFNIRKDAAIELDKIVKVMNENPTMVIELGSHTDCRSSVQFNQTLSTNRAKASAEYIQKRINNPSRIYGKGYGESQLLNDCGCEGTVKSNCTEEQHQLNRRTEFIIIKM